MLSARPSSNACSIGKCRDPLTRIPARPSSIFPTPTDRAARHRVAGVAAVVALVVCTLCGPAVAAVAASRPESGAPPAAEAQAPQAEQPAAEHGESVWAVMGRLFNFAILAGGLVYFLRSPLLAYLEQRRIQVRSDLSRAAELKAEAGLQMSEIDARMTALPGEIEALGRRGQEEVAAEEARIRVQAEAERQRLLDRARREIETELRVAERDLKTRAGELAVAVATERVKQAITDADQARLVDRYVAQVGEETGRGPRAQA